MLSDALYTRINYTTLLKIYIFQEQNKHCLVHLLQYNLFVTGILVCVVLSVLTTITYSH